MELQKAENEWDVAEDVCDDMEEQYNTMKREHDDMERKHDMALQQMGPAKDEAVRQAKDAQQQAEAELKALEMLLWQKEEHLTGELADLEKQLRKAKQNEKITITGMNLANTSAAKHQVTIGDLQERIGDLEARIAILTVQAATATPGMGGESSGTGRAEPGSQPPSKAGKTQE